MPTRTAAWIPRKHEKLTVGPAPATTPGAEQILVRVHAVAINSLDWIIQVEGNLTYGWLTYPAVLGSDVAGEVVEVGSAVTRFAVGDRVVGHAVGTDRDSDASEGGFQTHALLRERMTAPLPDALDYTEAAGIPLAASTAACALFQDDHLGLALPRQDAPPTGETVLVWGGSTSVGMSAIQLAAAAGYEVLTTASPRNADALRALGAAEVFDYRSATVEADIVAALRGRRFAGAVALGVTGAPACVRIAGAVDGMRFVSIGTPPVDFAGLGENGGLLARIRTTARLIGSNIALQMSAGRRRVRVKYIFGTTLKGNEVSHALYRDYLPAALADGRYTIAPPVTVVGHGLETIQAAMDRHRAGVSAQKLVVTV